MATVATMLNINDPMKTDRAFCDILSVTIILKDLGVAVVLAAENADNIDATANIEITNMLADIVSNKPLIDSIFMLGTIVSNLVPSALWAINAPPIESKQNSKGLNHNFSRIL
jgi:hypothetical protein